MVEQIELEAYRLEKDLTWLQLAAAMNRAAAAAAKKAGEAEPALISHRTLHYFLKRLPATARPADRTLHKVRKFLNTLTPAERRRLVKEYSKAIPPKARGRLLTKGLTAAATAT